MAIEGGVCRNVTGCSFYILNMRREYEVLEQLDKQQCVSVVARADSVGTRYAQELIRFPKPFIYQVGQDDD